MPDFNGFSKALEDELSANFKRYGITEQRIAHLGNGEYPSVVIIPPSKREQGCTLYVYVEKDNSREVIQVANTLESVPFDNTAAGLPVVIGKVNDNSFYQILSIDPHSLNNFTGGATPGQIAQKNNIMLTSKRIQEVNLYPVSGMVLGLTAGAIRINGTLYFLLNDDAFLDLTSSVPATAGKAKMVSIFHDGSVGSVVASSEFVPTAVTSIQSEIPTTVADGKIFLGAVYLYYGQTSIAANNIFRLQVWHGGYDPTFKVSSNDTTRGYAETKIVAGTGVSITTLNDGANETLQIAASSASLNDYKVKVTSADTTADYLSFKLAQGTAITLTTLSPGGNEDLEIAVNQSALSLASLGTRQFINLSDVPSSYTSQALKAVRVNAGETGLEFYTPSTVSVLDDLSDVVITAPANKDALYYDTGTSKWINGDVYVRNTGDSMSGNLTITTTTANPLDVGSTITLAANDGSLYTGMSSAATLNQNGFNATNVIGIAGINTVIGVTGTSGTVTGAAGHYAQLVKTGAGTLTTGAGVFVDTAIRTAGTVSALAGLYVNTQTITTTNSYGVYVGSISGGTNNYSIYTNAGFARFGDQLSVIGSADRIQAIFKNNGTQTTNNTEWQSSAGAILDRIDGNGMFHNFTNSEYSTFGRSFVGFNLFRNPVSGAYDRGASGSTGVGIFGDYSNGVMTVLAQHSSTVPPSTTTQTMLTLRASSASASTRAEVAGYLYVTGIGGVNDQLYVEVGSTSRTGIVSKAIASQTGDHYAARDSSGNNLFRVAASGENFIAQKAGTGTQNPAQTITSAAHTALTAGIERNEVKWDFSATQQFATGALGTQRAIWIKAPTYGFVGGSTLTDAVTLEISGAPAPGTNATITNAYAFRVAAGISRFNGNVQLGDVDMILGTTTGTKFGTSTTQKMAWWNATPVVQSTGWSATNYTASTKTLDGATATLTDVINVLGTLIDQYKTYGQLGA